MYVEGLVRRCIPTCGISQRTVVGVNGRDRAVVFCEERLSISLASRGLNERHTVVVLALVALAARSSLCSDTDSVSDLEFRDFRALFLTGKVLAKYRQLFGQSTHDLDNLSDDLCKAQLRQTSRLRQAALETHRVR